MMYHYYYGFSFLGFFINFLFWVALIWLAILLLRGAFGNHHHFESRLRPDRALQILRRRYAKGKITKKEFDTIKKDLSQL